jgi:hypothetical protein
MTLYKYIKIGILLALGTLIITTSVLYQKNQKLQRDLSISVSNEKAFISENSVLKEESRVFKFTIEQLNYYNDSILNKIIAIKEELKIKDKNLKQAQYLLSSAVKTDTIIFRDTLFKEPSLNLDTIVGDNWYNIKLQLKYPNTIITSPSFTSEKFIVTSYKKETVNPPSKYWIVRLFQKKHKVLQVNVVEKNPYIKVKKEKFIEIIE